MPEGAVYSGIIHTSAASGDSQALASTRELIVHTTHTAPVRELGAIEGGLTVGIEVGKDFLMIVGPAEKDFLNIMMGMPEGGADGGDGLG